VKISPALPEEAEALAAILRGWIMETDWLPKLHTPEEDRGFLAHLIESGPVLVARGPQPLGFLARQGGDVSCLYLARDARGQGVGKALLDAVKAVEPEISLWTFQANTGARRFYAREGFVEIEKTDGSGNDERLPDVRLVWRRA
jgi:GNAT superfamily N-acetyltransferase